MIGSSDNDYLSSRILAYAMTHFAFLWRIVNGIPPLARWMNRRLITRAVERAPNRPNPFSTRSDYTSWESLTDRTWFGRHLPAAPLPPPGTKPVWELPPVAKVADLFRRKDGRAVESAKSTLLFPSFAQWFTDGFLLTDPDNRLKTHTNHDIDFSALYGLIRAEADCLRVTSETPGERGRLKSQWIAGEEYAPYLYGEGDTVKPEFAALRKPLHLPPDWDAVKRRSLFAFGGERANSTPQTAMLNTLFLREHNRLARVIGAAHPDWDDERVFQTVRNTVTVLLLAIVVEEYINHLSPYHFHFLADPGVAKAANWNRPNWCAVEFNLLYRWHGLVPDTIQWPGGDVTLTDWLFDNAPLTRAGLAAAFVATSKQKATKLGLFNTPDYLVGRTEVPSILQGRAARLRSYNEYRVAAGFPPAKTFEAINPDPAVVAGLRELYGHPDNIEFYVGLFAEGERRNAAVMALIGRFVAIDAFSQAFTNPLLSEHVFNEATFGPEGMACIAATHSLEDLLRRNIPSPAALVKGSVTMRQS